MTEQIPSKYVRVPESEDPSKVFKVGAGGFPIRDPEHLMKETGAESTEEAFKQVKDISSEEARSMGIRLPGTPQIYGEQTKTLTPEMLASIPAGEVTPTEIEGAGALPNPEDVLGGEIDTTTIRNQLSSANTTIASLQQSLIDIQKQIEENARKRKEEAEAEQKGILDKLKGLVGGSEKKAKELEEEADLKKTQDAYKEILNKMDTRQALLFGELRQIEGGRISAAQMGREQSEARRQAQIDLALLQAQASILQRDYSFAKQTIDTTMGYIEKDKQDEMNYYSTLLQLSNQKIVSFTKEEKDAFNAQLGIIEKATEDKKDELEQKGNLMLDAIKNYGVELPDLTGLTIEEAQKVYQETIAPFATEERELELAKARADIARTKDLTTGGGGGKEDKQLSLNEIDIFRRAYGWTPPMGFTNSQLTQFMKDNPNRTPEELEKAANEVATKLQGESTETTGETEEETTKETGEYLSDEWFKEKYTTAELKKVSDKLGTSKWYTPKGMDINRALRELMTKIKEARGEGHSDDEILKYLEDKYF